MDSVLTTLVRKQVRDYLLDSLEIEPIDILGDGSKWILATKFRDHFAGDKANIGTRNGKDYPDAYYQEKKGKPWYIKIEYIPAVVAKLMSSHALPQILETILHNYFSDLNVPIVDGKPDTECYKPDEKLMDFIENLDDDPKKAADQIKRLKSEI